MSELERVPSFLPAQEAAPIQPEQAAEQESAAPKVAPQPQAPVEVLQRVQSSIGGQQFVAQDPRVGMLKQVEELLAEGLMQLYMSLPEERRAVFKQKGEEVANKITDMILYGKARVKEVWKLIGEWLRLVPGVNKYYLEQEIKIKTDKIMTLVESEQT